MNFNILLRKARLNAGYSLAEIANILKIPEIYLIAIENNDYAKLPSCISVKRYIKNYTRFLNLDIKSLESFSFENNQEINSIKRPIYSDYIPSSIVIFTSVSLIFLINILWNNIESKRDQELQIASINKSSNILFESMHNLIEIKNNKSSTIDKFQNNDDIAFVAKEDCVIKVFSSKGELFDDKYLHRGEIYYTNNKLNLTFTISYQDKVEIFNIKDLKI